MTTPEQPQAWRKAGEQAWMEDLSVDMRAHPQTMYAAGYLRRCQETEQAIKDARKQALEEAIAICRSFEGGGINGILGARTCASRIQELLK